MKSTEKITEKVPTIDIKKYGGKQVAIVDGRIIASGKTLMDVTNKARKRASKKKFSEIRVFSVPKTMYVIYYG